MITERQANILNLRTNRLIVIQLPMITKFVHEQDLNDRQFDLFMCVVTLTFYDRLATIEELKKLNFNDLSLAGDKQKLIERFLIKEVGNCLVPTFPICSEKTISKKLKSEEIKENTYSYKK